jgi:hypothetical protein
MKIEYGPEKNTMEVTLLLELWRTNTLQSDEEIIEDLG